MAAVRRREADSPSSSRSAASSPSKSKTSGDGHRTSSDAPCLVRPSTSESAPAFRSMSHCPKLAALAGTPATEVDQTDIAKHNSQDADRLKVESSRGSSHLSHAQENSARAANAVAVLRSKVGLDLVRAHSNGSSASSEATTVLSNDTVQAFLLCQSKGP